jgi:hypothetical protein
MDATGLILLHSSAHIAPLKNDCDNDDERCPSPILHFVFSWMGPFTAASGALLPPAGGVAQQKRRVLLLLEEEKRKSNNNEAAQNNNRWIRAVPVSRLLPFLW